MHPQLTTLLLPSINLLHLTTLSDCYSAPSYFPTTETAEYCAVPTYYTAAATSYYVDPNYYSGVLVYFKKIYAAPSYYTEAP
jgi:hypothetical protein